MSDIHRPTYILHLTAVDTVNDDDDICKFEGYNANLNLDFCTICRHLQSDK